MRVKLLVDAPFSERDYRRYGVSDLRAIGLDVSVWDVSPLFRPNARLQHRDEISKIQVDVFEDQLQLSSAISALQEDDAVIALAGVTRTDWPRYEGLWTRLSESSAILIAVSVGHIPLQPWGVQRGRHVRNVAVMTHYHSVTQWKSMRSHLAYSPFFRDLSKSVRAFGARVRGLDAVFFGTSFADISPNLLSGRTRMVPIHNLDYDLILGRAAELRPWQLCNEIVFIDGMGPNHPDFVTLDSPKSQCPPDVYFAAIDRVLSAVEASSGQRVSIKAHPRSPPGAAEENYRGRLIHYGSPIDTMASARWVLMSHASTLVASATFLMRPISFIDCLCFDDSVRSEMRNMKRLTGANLINADTLDNLDPPTINHRRYRAFVRAYLKQPGTPESPFWQEVARLLLELR